MRTSLFSLAVLILLGSSAMCLSKPHVVSFGKTVSVKWFVGASEEKAVDTKIRPLYVDSRLKEFTTGSPHDVTDRMFVVRRVFRLNDALPSEPAAAPQWRWQRGGWLLVDRVTGRVTSVLLPEFDPYYSAISWYRDYAAYCGVSDDSKKFYLVVAQIGRRKPLLKEAVKDVTLGNSPDSSCPPPSWQRRPARVTFNPKEKENLTYTIRGRAVEMTSDKDDEEEDAALK